MATDYLKQRAKAVKWLRENATAADWWNWPVLTSHNPNDNPALTDVCARRVFEDLERQKLLEPIHATAQVDGHNVIIGVFRLSLSDDDKWTSLANPPGRCRSFWIAVGSFLNAPITVALVSGVLSLVGAFAGAYAATLWGNK